jgi:uncharacterized membrane protein
VNALWVLSLFYWLHMLATVVWIGGLAALAWLVLPAAQRSLDARVQAAFLENLQRRLDPLGWLCLIVLAVTGMFQMSASPNYEGFLTIANRWGAAILVKHILFGLMIGVSAYVTWGVLPALRRAVLRQAQGQTFVTEGLQRQGALLLRLNLLLGVLVLALTALARVS